MSWNVIRGAQALAAVMAFGAVVIGQQGTWPSGPPPHWESVEDMHDFYFGRFQSSYGFGSSRMPQPPMLDRSGVLDLGARQYSIERLELVGLLESATPVVYVPVRHHVRFATEGFRSRELTPFETRALMALRRGRSIETAEGEQPGALEVVGALRGDPSCLKCHKENREGDLLGAFTYRLRARKVEYDRLRQP
jgi:hypothetical protein